MIEWPQYRVFAGLSIGAAVSAGILYFSDNLLFERFLGSINPLLATFIIISLGVVSFFVLLSKGWFAIYKKGNLKGLLRRSVPGALFALITILTVDIRAPFPADINILFPKSLLFYPAIGFFAEILFHVLPLTALLIALTSIFKNMSHENIVWISIPIVALLEVIYQAMPMISSGHFPLWAMAMFCINLFLFELSQLYIFKRYDFISMYSFRLVYYMFWHIGWGYIRLKLLF